MENHDSFRLMAFLRFYPVPPVGASGIGIKLFFGLWHLVNETNKGEKYK